MKICMIGEGAFGHKYLDAIQNIDGVKVSSIVGSDAAATKATAEKYNILHWTMDLDEALAQPDIEAAIITSPMPIHAAQGQQVMRAGKHVLVEIPIADSLADAEALCATQKETGLIAMAGHVRRFNPSHQYAQQNQSGRAEDSADGCTGVFLPP